MVCSILVPRPGIELGPSAMKACSPNHWTSREFPVAVWALAPPKPPQTTSSLPFILLPVTSLSGNSIPRPFPSPQPCWIQRPGGNSGTGPPPPWSAPTAAASRLWHYRLCALRSGAGGCLRRGLGPGWVAGLASTAPVLLGAPPNHSCGSGPEGCGAAVHRVRVGL